MAAPAASELGDGGAPALAAPLAAWLLSTVLLALPSILGTPPVGSTSALALLPWLALAGLPPAAAAEHPAAGPRRALFWMALALPPAVLGLALEEQPSIRRLAAALSLVGLWCLAAEAPRGPRARRAYALVWLLAVPATAALGFALRFAALPGELPAPGWLAALLRAHPLAWIWREGQEPGAWPLAFAVLLWLGFGAARGRR